MKVKSNINKILPVILSLLIPIISFYSNQESTFLKSFDFFTSWFIASTILYVIWHLLYYLWDLKSLLKMTSLFLILIISTLIYLWISQIVVQLKWFYVLRAILIGLVFLVIQYALKAQKNISLLLIEKEQIQTENYKVQLKALRTQIDPHFLFNSLNTLRAMVRQQHHNAEKFVLSLSDFYRQTLIHNENITLALSEEIKVLESYLFLMKSRNEKAVSVNLEIDQSLNTYHLPFFALQIVVENCFKHNSMTSKNPLKINIENTVDFHIQVSNNIQPKIGNSKSSGYGLSLLKKRYALMNVQEGVMIEKTDKEFMVKLKLIEI